MPSRFFLNATQSKQGGLPAPDKGVWHSDPAFLTRYAGDISMDGELDASSVPHSVPSVFQRPFQFLHALRNEANPHHKAMQSEWRGLLALIALGEWLGVKVTVVPFTVPKVDAAASSYVGNEDIGNLHFRAMLRNQLPYRKVEEEAGISRAKEERVSDWEEWSIIRCGGKLIGATSPWTMVYTASKYVAPPSVAWQKDGLLIDPILHFTSVVGGASKPIELSILYALVTDVLAKRTSWEFPSSLSTFANLYSGLLKSWQTDLQPYMVDGLKIGETSTLFTKAPYVLSLRTVGDLKRDDGDLYMDTKRGRVIVFCKATHAKSRVYRGMFAEQVDIAALPGSGTSFSTKDGTVIPKAFVVVEKAFFPAKLIHIDLSGQGFVARNSPQISTPLTPAFFEYFDHADLVWLSATVTNGITKASLRLPLSNGEYAAAEHGYDAKDIQTLFMKTPGLALWPDVYDREWKGGFAAYAGVDTDDLSVSPVFQSGRLPDGEDRAEIGKNQKDVRIWQCEDEPAIGFSLEWRAKGEPVKRVPVGLILLRELKTLGRFSETRAARIGVDFGTSSTTVMIADGVGAAKELEFGGHLVSLTNETFGRLTEIERNLYPATKVVPPFRTLLYEASATQFGRHTTPYTVRFATDIKYDLLNAPVSDLKWGAQTGRDGSNPLTAYLNGLVRYIIWECLVRGMKDIEFSWSYPTSLPKGQFTTMQNFWGNISAARYRAGLILREPVEMSESEAVCRSLAAGAGKLRSSRLTIAVDVGGGSTDIAYWSDRKRLDQTSLKLAGNDILDKRLLTEKAMIAIFDALGEAKPGPAEMASIRERPEIYLNDLLAKTQVGGDPLIHPLRRHIFDGLDDAAPWQAFRSMIYLYFTGLCYYLGTQARLFAVDRPEIEVYFVGRGTSMLSWFSATPKGIRKVLEYSFRLGLNRPKDDNVANQFPGIPDVALNFEGLGIAANEELPRLKTEVAEGLLVASELELENDVPEGIQVGETGWTKKKDSASIDWNSRMLAPEELDTFKVPADSAFDSGMIGHFRYVVLEGDKEKFLTIHNLDAANLKSLKVVGTLVEELVKTSYEGKSKMAQPIFAYELKALMSEYARLVSLNGTESK